jgi:hypothetical protein
MNDSEQILVAEGLAQDRGCTLLECPGSNLVIRMGRYKDDRGGALHVMQMALKLETTQARHPNIENQTVWFANAVGV